MRVSVKYSGPGTSAQTWFEGATKKITQNVTEVVKDSIQEGEQITKHNIETRGTMKSGKRGRVETGKMRDAVGSKVESVNIRKVVGKFGRINAFQRYFGLQEDGFDHVGGVTVEGMNSLSDAAKEVFDNIEDDIDRAVKRA